MQGFFFLPGTSFLKTYIIVNRKQNKNVILMVKSVLFFFSFLPGSIKK